MERISETRSQPLSVAPELSENRKFVLKEQFQALLRVDSIYIILLVLSIMADHNAEC
jgi:hypothetical protein